jgi:hypothetical protein
MKHIICDQCRVEVAPDSYGLAPAGWITVRWVWPPFVDPADLCSPVCAVAYFSGFLTQIPVAPDVAPSLSE